MKATAILLLGIDQSLLQQPGQLRAMLPLVDKPALQITVESLVRLGCTQFHVFLEESPATVRDFLGNGERWGIQLTYHYLDGNLSFAANFKRLAIDPAQTCWLAYTERIPQEFISPGNDWALTGDTAFFHGPQHQPAWTGWGHFAAAFLQTLEVAPNSVALARYLLADRQVVRHGLALPYDLTSEPSYQESTIRYLTQLTENKVGQTIIARSARIHPTATITGPAYIGPNARIEAYAIIGPNAVIGHDSVIDESAEVVRTIALPETYVGHGLFLEEAVVAPGTLASIKNQTTIEKIEPHLLATSRRTRQLRSSSSNITAKLLRLFLFPLYTLARIRCRGNSQAANAQLRIFRADGTSQGAEVVTLPIAATARHSPVHGRGSWSAHFVGTFYPGLTAVAAEEIELFGLELRDIEDIAKLPNDWQALYYAHPAGLLNETMINFSLVTDTTLRYASDACVAAGLPTRTKLHILRSYLFNVLRDCSRLCRAPYLAKP